MFKRNRHQPVPAPVMKTFEFHYRGRVYLFDAHNRGEVLDMARAALSAQAVREGFLA